MFPNFSLFGGDKVETELTEKIMKVFLKNNLPESPSTCKKIAADIKRLGWENVKMFAEMYSPSQLGRMNLLGVRVLAQIYRDYPEKYNKIINDLDEIMKN